MWQEMQLEAVQKRSVELLFTTWKLKERGLGEALDAARGASRGRLPVRRTGRSADEVQSLGGCKVWRQRLAKKPRGSGWQRVGDKAPVEF